MSPTTAMIDPQSPAIAERKALVDWVGSSRAWPVVPLGELAADERNAITDGPFGSKLKTDHYTASGPRVIRLKNIGDTEFVDAKAHISEAHFATLQKHRVFPGDVVIAALGEDPPRSCLVPEYLGPAIVKADCIRFKAGQRILPKFINYVLNAPDLRRYAKAIVHGVGRPRLNLGEIRALPIPVPPLPEQRRIVAEIEKQFTRLEAGVAALRRVQANLKRYRAAVLKAASEGRLVPTEAELHRQRVGRAPSPGVGGSKKEGKPSPTETIQAETPFESGEALLARILTERRESWNGRGQYKEAAEPETSKLSGIPDGWAWATVEQLASPEPNSITDGPFGSNLKTEHYTESGPRVLRLQNIGDGVYIDEEAHISRAHFERLQKHRIFAGDVIIAGFGENPPRSCIVPESLGPAIVKADCIRFRPHRSVLPKYMNAVLNCDPVRKRTKSMVHGIGRPRLNLGEIKSIVLPLPPLAEQTRIVQEVERRLSVVEELESVVTANLQRATRLRQAVLHRAFSGDI